MRHIVFKTSNTCSQVIEFDLTDDSKISNLKFFGGCNGNLKAIARLVEGKDANEISSILEGNTCGNNTTSCADQLARAIKENI